MTRRTECKKIATRKTHEVFKTGASECAHTWRWLRVLPVVLVVVLPPCCRWCRSRLRILATPSRLVTARSSGGSDPVSGRPPPPVRVEHG